MGDSVVVERLNMTEDGTRVEEKTLKMKKSGELNVNYWYMEVHM